MWSLVSLYIKLCVQKRIRKKTPQPKLQAFFVIIKLTVRRKILADNKVQCYLDAASYRSYTYIQQCFTRREFVYMCEKVFGRSHHHIVHFPYCNLDISCEIETIHNW